MKVDKGLQVSPFEFPSFSGGQSSSTLNTNRFDTEDTVEITSLNFQRNPWNIPPVMEPPPVGDGDG